MFIIVLSVFICGYRTPPSGVIIPRQVWGKVVFKNYPDIIQMLQGWERGEIDWYGFLPLDHVARIQHDFKDTAYFKELPNHAYDYISINLRHPILSDLRVRQALMYGLNRPALVDSVLKGYGIVINGHQVPASWAHNPDLYAYHHNAAKARELLDEAGWSTIGDDGIRRNANGDKLTLSIIANHGNLIRENIAAQAKTFWAQIGVDINVDILEWSVVLEKFSRTDYDLIVIGWNLGLDPQPTMFHSSQAVKNAQGNITGFNRGQYINPEVDALLDLAAVTMDIEARKEIFQQIDVILNRELPYLWLFVRKNVTAINNRVQGVTWSTIGPIYPELMYIKP